MREFKFGIIILLSLLVISISGCQTKESLETYEPLKISEFEPIPEYKVDTKKLDDLSTDTLTSILGSQLYVKVDKDNGTVEFTYDENVANAVLFYSEDFAKLADLAEISDGYKNIVKAQEELINTKNETIRSLQQLVILQQQSRDIYRENFILSNKLYLQEHKIRMREKLSNDIRYFTTAVGIIGVAMF